MSIPKIIHYCWFGHNPKPKLVQLCIQSWKKHLPEYELIEWNEKNFDIEKFQFTLEAYNLKKWAFVSDFVRIWVLKEYGGVYLDTDVEIKKTLNPLLEHYFFSGFENYEGNLSPIVSAVMGSQKECRLIDDIFLEYKSKPFINPDGEMNTTQNTVIISRILIAKYKIDKSKDCHQVGADNINIYPSTFFCTPSPSSYAIHHFAGSWLNRSDRLKHKIYSATYMPDFLKKIAFLVLRKFHRQINKY